MNKVLESLLARQTFKESRFNPRAVSPVGAKGLTQFMPGTWRDFQKISGDYTLDAFNPEHSIKAQRWYMEHLDQIIANKDPNLSEEERVPWVLAAYNWGPANAGKLFSTIRKEGKDVSNVSTWISRLPKETEDYVKTIYLKKDPKFEKKFEFAMSNGVIEKYYDNTNFSGPTTPTTPTTSEDSELVMPVDLISEATKKRWALLEEEKRRVAEANLRPTTLSGTKQFLPLSYIEMMKSSNNKTNVTPPEKTEEKLEETKEVPELFTTIFNNKEVVVPKIDLTTKFVIPSFKK